MVIFFFKDGIALGNNEGGRVMGRHFGTYHTHFISRKAEMELWPKSVKAALISNNFHSEGHHQRNFLVQLQLQLFFIKQAEELGSFDST